MTAPTYPASLLMPYDADAAGALHALAAKKHGAGASIQTLRASTGANAWLLVGTSGARALDAYVER